MSAMPRVSAGEFDLNGDKKKDEIFPLPQPATNPAAPEKEEKSKLPGKTTGEAPVVAPASRTTSKFFSAIFALSFSFISASTPVFFIAAETPFLPYISGGLGAQTSSTWIVLANFLATAAIAPIAGSLSDFIGRRWASLLGHFWILFGTIMTGIAGRVEIAIGGMAIAGVGTAFAEVSGFAGVAELVPVQHRGFYFSAAFLFALPFGACTSWALLFANNGAYGWASWIQVILSGLSLAFIGVLYYPAPQSPSYRMTIADCVSRIDFIGAVLWGSGIALFLLGIQFGGYTYPWRTAQVIATTTVGLCNIILFVLWEIHAPNPLIPSRLFENKFLSTILLILVGLAGVNFTLLFWFYPSQSLLLFPSSLTSQARHLAPFGVTLIVSIIVVNYTISRFNGSIRYALFISACLMTAGLGALPRVTDTTPHLGIGLSVLAALGLGGLIQPTATVLTVITPDNFIGTITGLATSVRLVGGAIGYTLFYNVLVNKLGTQTFESSDVQPELLVSAFRKVFLVGIAFGGATVIASCFVQDVSGYMDDRVVATLPENEAPREAPSLPRSANVSYTNLF